MSSSRPFDVVLFGATGFTGGLIAEYLVGRVGDHLRIGLAGRDRAKLESVRRRLVDRQAAGGAGSPAAELGILEADSGDPASLRAMARQTRVIITTVGPYARYGEPLVAACIEAGTDYVDLTGETGWWREMVERYHERAVANEVLIIPSCGYDCIPADMGALFCATQLAAAGAAGQPMKIDTYVQGMGSASGGTVASALEMLGTGTMVEPDEPDKPPLLHYAADVDRWVVRSIVLDPWVVQRSAELRPDEFGGQLRFHQYFAFPSRVTAALAVGFGAAALTMAKLGPVRALIRKLRPSGAGPSAEQRSKGWFRADFVGRAGGREVRTHVRGGDPGYGETSKMISEAAIMLAEARDQLPMRGGVVTTATGLGLGFVDRLVAAGLEFAVD